MSTTDRFITPSSSSKIRSPAILSASRSAMPTVSAWVTPTSTHRPASIEPTTCRCCSSDVRLVTDARATRWTSPRMRLASQPMERSPETTELRAGDVRVTIDLEAGGRIAQIDVAGQPLLWAGPAAAIGWGSYPMAPWVGRLRHGRFEFGGTTYHLALNHTDDEGTSHAIHGTVFDAAWTLDRSDDTTAHLHCTLSAA